MSNHDQASQSVPALPKFYRKCEKGVKMAATFCLFDKRKSFFNTYKYSICLVVISTSTDLAIDKATCLLTPDYSTWQGLLFKQKDIAIYHCTVFYLILRCFQIIQAIPQWYLFCVYIILLHLIYSLLNITPTKLKLSVLVLTLYIL